MSTGHLLILLIIIVFIFGPSRLEGIGSSLGKGIRGFKKGLEEGEESKNAAKKSAEIEDKT